MRGSSHNSSVCVCVFAWQLTYPIYLHKTELHRVRTIYRSAPSKFGSLVLTALCANICFSQIYGHTCAPSITMSWTCAVFRLWAEPKVNPIKIAFAAHTHSHTHIDFGYNSVPINGIDHRSQHSTATCSLRMYVIAFEYNYHVNNDVRNTYPLRLR